MALEGGKELPIYTVNVDSRPSLSIKVVHPLTVVFAGRNKVKL